MTIGTSNVHCDASASRPTNASASQPTNASASRPTNGCCLRHQASVIPRTPAAGSTLFDPCLAQALTCTRGSPPLSQSATSF